jgi:hypothetical protein
MIRVVHPGSGFFIHPGYQIQTSKRHRIPDPDPQHCHHRTILLKEISVLRNLCIRIGISILILAIYGSYHKFYTCAKIWFFYLQSRNCQLTMFYLSQQCQRFHNFYYFRQHIKIFWKKVLSTLSFAWNWFLFGSGKMTRIRRSRIHNTVNTNSLLYVICGILNRNSKVAYGSPVTVPVFAIDRLLSSDNCFCCSGPDPHVQRGRNSPCRLNNLAPCLLLQRKEQQKQ